MSRSKTENAPVLTRRDALKLSAGAGIAAAIGGTAHASDSTKTGVHQQQPPFCSTPPSAVAATKYGKVRGFVSGNVFTFKGVPYGQDTGGKNRWLPAKSPLPWDGEYPALIYGANCPQRLHDWHSQEQVFLQDWDDGWQSEDMLKLN
ncbi:MAG: carboxylesterase family protein, partial [Acidobacteriaceae bacterium]